MQTLAAQIAQEVKAHEAQVRSAIELLDSGATVPFIARYRKEATGGLDDSQLREIDIRCTYLRELQERREAVMASIREQGRLTPALLAALQAAPTKQELEDLYLPFKPRRRTRGQMAREAGLEPLADLLWADPTLDPLQAAAPYVQSAVNAAGDDFTSLPLVLDGVRDILSERWADEATLVQALRQWLWQEGVFQSRLVAGRDGEQPEAAKFRDYFDYAEPIARVPSHRALAVFRGRALELLDVRLTLPESDMPPAPAVSGKSAIKNESKATLSPAEARMALALGWRHQGRAADDLIRRSLAWTWRVKLSLSLERDLFTRLREDAEQVAIKVFADNLRDLLLAAPAGPRVVMGLDPGIRTGVKVAVVDATGRLVETATVFPHEPRRDWDGALHTLGRLCRQHGVNLVAIGNGTASRETDRLASELLRQQRDAGVVMDKVVVSEAGASVYSASEFASQEMPEVDVSLRGAASIARRLQDPLAELVKIEPKSIGVGQYQHDVNQQALARTLDAVVEDCVNAVGVDLNTASVPLLARVSGLGHSVARALVRWRETHGAFANRQQLRLVSGLGERTFEQCAGFLRIRGGENPLDMTGVHPETYPVVEKIMARTGQPVSALMGRAEVLRALKPEWFADGQFGAITVTDILGELEKPGRDPRPDFRVARFDESVQDIGDLRVGMVLEGTVSNVAAFGAFVDLGVHQDGLVHVSQLSRKFVKDAREIVKTGDIVRVQVQELDVARKRIGLTMKLGETPTPREAGADNRFRPASTRQVAATRAAATAEPRSAMAQAFARVQGSGQR